MPSLSRPACCIRNLSFLVVLAIPAPSLHAQGRDLYPQVHGLLLEAEAASANIRFLDDRSNPRTSIGGLFALRAGHISKMHDVLFSHLARVRRVRSALRILACWVVYGRMDRVEKSIDAMTDPEGKARFLLSLADLLWRTGRSCSQALEQGFAQLGEIDHKAADLGHRKQPLDPSTKASSSSILILPGLSTATATCDLLGSMRRTRLSRFSRSPQMASETLILAPLRRVPTLMLIC